MFIIHLFPLDHRLGKVIKANVFVCLIALYLYLEPIFQESRIID